MRRSFGLLGLLPSAAFACPDCWPGKEARALVVSDHFWQNLGIALLPFIIVAAVTWAIHRWLDRADAIVEEAKWTR